MGVNKSMQPRTQSMACTPGVSPKVHGLSVQVSQRLRSLTGFAGDTAGGQGPWPPSSPLSSRAQASGLNAHQPTGAQIDNTHHARVRRMIARSMPPLALVAALLGTATVQAQTNFTATYTNQ